MEKNSKRIVYFDIIRIVATFFVINIHVISIYNNKPMNIVPLSWWWFGNISHSLSRFSVPVFIMISGALLLGNNKREGIKDFFEKRLFKVFIPFFFWSVIYILWQAHLSHNYKNINILYILKSIIAKPVYYHMWFVYIIIPLYLVTPIIKKMMKNLDDKEIRYLFLLWGITTSYSYISYFAKINIGFNISYISGYIGYFILGYYLYKINVNKRKRNICYIIGLLSLISTIIGTYLMTINSKGVFNQYMYEYLQPNIILMSITVFIFFKYSNFENIGRKNVIIKLSNACLFVAK